MWLVTTLESYTPVLGLLHAAHLVFRQHTCCVCCGVYAHAISQWSGLVLHYHSHISWSPIYLALCICTSWHTSATILLSTVTQASVMLSISMLLHKQQKASNTIMKHQTNPLTKLFVWLFSERHNVHVMFKNVSLLKLLTGIYPSQTYLR